MRYNEDSIQTLKPLEAIRLKLGMYVGSADNQAVHHIIKEILSNSIDEFLAGFPWKRLRMFLLGHIPVGNLKRMAKRLMEPLEV